jgi:hypothetical protein
VADVIIVSRIVAVRIIFTRIGCTLLTCDMYMSDLRHINDPVLLSLKMEGIRLLFHCTHSNGVCHTGLLTAYEQDQDGTQFHPDPARKLSANLYDIYHYCVYSEKFLMMDRGTVRNM